ncbi:hypothetical protein GCM10011532_32630 [Christiangramia forsetii]|nr:hypothetical protein GCM10011532_32630 [Christiangramia forsetii]
MCLIFGQGKPNEKIIVIDPGHGGKDSGAIGINRIQEKDVVLNIAKETLRLNENLDDPFDIYLTRYNDTLISLSDRTKLTRTLQADLFISLHCNHSYNPNARGIEIYVANKPSNHSDDSTWFAFQLQDDLNKKLGFESRGVKFGNFQVLLETIGYCTSVLLELGFLSNGDESKYYEKQESIKALALVIWESLINN